MEEPLAAAPVAREERLGALLAHWVPIVFAVAMIAHLLRQGVQYAHDDAFISFRYALNLARGQGLVFNVGECVMGFTSPLQVLFLGGLTALGFETPTVCYAASIVWLALTSIVCFHLLRPGLGTVGSACVSIFVLTMGETYSYLGMETNLLVFLQSLFLLLLLRARHDLAVLIASLSCLTRPDSVLLVVPVLLLTRQTRTLRHVALFGMPGIAWVLFAYAYYGHVLPQSLHAKQSLTPFAVYLAESAAWLTRLPLPNGLGGGQSWTRGGAGAIVRGVVLLLASFAVLANARLRGRSGFVYAGLVYPWLLVLAYSAIGSARLHFWEIYSGFHFFVLAWAAGGASLFILAAERGCGRGGWWGISGRALAATAASATLVVGGLQASRAAQRVDAFAHARWHGARHETYRRISAWIDRNLESGATCGMLEVGTIGYYTNLHIIDVAGIVTLGVGPGERLRFDRVAQRFRPRYLLMAGHWPTVEAGRGLTYRLSEYFPDSGFADFSLMERVD